jgi:hypothetical protein
LIAFCIDQPAQRGGKRWVSEQTRSDPDGASGFHNIL